MVDPGSKRRQRALGTRISDLRRYRRYLARELDNASLYRGLAGDAQGEHREVLLELAAAEERHAQFWQAKLGDLGVAVPRAEDHRVGFTARALAWLGRRLGVRRVVPLLERVEAGERTRYDDEAAATPTMVAEERFHAELVASLAPAWRSRASGSIRAAVFGVNDGLVSNLSLVMGMAGGNAGTQTVLLAGLAGLVAGAGSMAAGEYISVKSQRELVEAGTRLGPAELATMAEREPVAFELLARAWGLQDSAAEGTAPGDGPSGRNADNVGSPLAAPAYSFVAFGAGAAVPVLRSSWSRGLPRSAPPRCWPESLCSAWVRASASSPTGEPLARACANWRSGPSPPRVPTPWAGPWMPVCPDSRSRSQNRLTWPLGPPLQWTQNPETTERRHEMADTTGTEPKPPEPCTCRCECCRDES